MKIQASIVLAGAACLAAAGWLLYGCGGNNPAGPGPGPGSNPPFDSGVKGAGFSFAQSFSVAGNVPYFCTPHAPGMTGSVTVSASSSTDSVLVVVGPSGMLSFSPSSVTVKVGGQVRWTWSSGGHSVTSGTPTVANMRMPPMPGMEKPTGH